MTKVSTGEGFLELSVTIHVSICERVFKVNEKRVILAQFNVVVNQLLSRTLHLLALDFILVRILWVFVVQIFSITVDT